MARAPRKNGTGPKVWIHATGSWLRESSMNAGWAATVKNCTTGETVCLSGGMPFGPEVSNIRAEMVAVVKALESIPDNSTVTLWVPCDFMPNSIRYGHKRNANLDVWEQLDRQLVRHVIKRFHHSPLHYGKPDMLEAHRKAQETAAQAAAPFAIDQTAQRANI